MKWIIKYDLFFQITSQDKMETSNAINFDDGRCVEKLYFILQLIFENALIFCFLFT